ncbi:DUF2971 domain-containing protein [Caenimonas terrae]|uniref:DUF2971 domain-containing protein n=1 Tax=Caenimonas terrae TaxID=696074 RepID=A0ABW0NAW1_9BURK
MTHTARQLGHRSLYHWQRFNPDAPALKHVERLEAFLRSGKLFCSSPSAFNDPWDCKPHFNTELLNDARELQRHADWAVEITNRRAPMSVCDTEAMRRRLLADIPFAVGLLEEMSVALGVAIAEKYRVYCLGPTPSNTLMWSHYADDHKGICLEYSVDNDVFCCALECEYLEEFPMLRPYDVTEEEDLRVLLAKSDVWRYENEFRLIVEERAHAPATSSALLADDCMLQLPQGALTGIIVGCQGPLDTVRGIVESVAPHVRVRRATRVPNRYELHIET